MNQSNTDSTAEKTRPPAGEHSSSRTRRLERRFLEWQLQELSS